MEFDELSDKLLNHLLGFGVTLKELRQNFDSVGADEILYSIKVLVEEGNLIASGEPFNEIYLITPRGIKLLKDGGYTALKKSKVLQEKIIQSTIDTNQNMQKFAKGTKNVAILAAIISLGSFMVSLYGTIQKTDKNDKQNPQEISQKEGMQTQPTGILPYVRHVDTCSDYSILKEKKK